jgi:hypothetical protein
MVIELPSRFCIKNWTLSASIFGGCIGVGALSFSAPAVRRRDMWIKPLAGSDISRRVVRSWISSVKVRICCEASTPVLPSKRSLSCPPVTSIESVMVMELPSGVVTKNRISAVICWLVRTLLLPGVKLWSCSVSRPCISCLWEERGCRLAGTPILVWISCSRKAVVVFREGIKRGACSSPFTGTVRVLIDGAGVADEAPRVGDSWARRAGIKVFVWGSPFPGRG